MRMLRTQITHHPKNVNHESMMSLSASWWLLSFFCPRWHMQNISPSSPSPSLPPPGSLPLNAVLSYPLWILIHICSCVSSCSCSSKRMSYVADTHTSLFVICRPYPSAAARAAVVWWQNVIRAPQFIHQLDMRSGSLPFLSNLILRFRISRFSALRAEFHGTPKGSNYVGLRGIEETHRGIVKWKN